MDFKQIQELIKLINKSNIGEVSIEEKGFKLTIKQKEEAAQTVFAAPQQLPQMTYQAAPAQAPQAGPAASGDKTKAGARFCYRQPHYYQEPDDRHVLPQRHTG